MLHYKITDIFLWDIDVIEKRVWDTQTSAYAQKTGMTNTDFLRWRLFGCKLGEKEKEEKDD